MSGILQQGYSMGYVFAACANLGVGGGTETWKTVFWIAGESPIPIEYYLPTTNNLSCSAGISIAVGLVRICFPESQSFIEAKKAGKRTMNAGEFWRETISMLGKEWRMCVYCIILMTWVCYERYSSSYQHLSNLSRDSSISIPTHPKTHTPHSCSLQRSLITRAPRGLQF